MRENCFIRQKFLVRQSRERLPEFEFRPATRLPGIYMHKYTKSGRILQFFARFFHGAGLNPGQTGRSGRHLFRRRQSHCPRDAGLAGKMPVVGDDEQRSPIPCNGAGRMSKQAGKKPETVKPAGRDNGTEKPEPTKPESGNDETECLRGIFSDQRFALA